MKLPITSNPKRSELENLTPEHLAYLQSLDVLIERYNNNEIPKPEIPADVRTILYYMNEEKAFRAVEDYEAKNGSIF
ncbi:hypothetical protein QT970_03435 [Microcoleus sp. herbarium8]|uniref:hypothetical protein n=1 Tax=Microcoleus sp. herbarium8 TaxID=3055436 RepID=UPI002FD76512